MTRCASRGCSVGSGLSVAHQEPGRGSLDKAMTSEAEAAFASLGPYDLELYLRRLTSEELSESSVRQTRAILRRSSR